MPRAWAQGRDGTRVDARVNGLSVGTHCALFLSSRQWGSLGTRGSGRWFGGVLGRRSE